MGTITMADVMNTCIFVGIGFAFVIIEGQLPGDSNFATFGLVGMLISTIAVIFFLYKFFKTDKPKPENPHRTLPKGFEK